MPKPDYKKRRFWEEESTWIRQIITQAQTREFYGKLTIILEEGKIQRVLKEESLKPPA